MKGAQGRFLAFPVLTRHTSGIMIRYTTVYYDAEKESGRETLHRLFCRSQKLGWDLRSRAALRIEPAV